MGFQRKRIFPASSIVDFARERDLIENITADLNNELFEKGIFLCFDRCETLSKEMVPGRKQDISSSLKPVNILWKKWELL